MPAISTFSMNSRMTRSTQRNQIASLVCSTFSQRLDVMNLFHHNHAAFLEALLTVWMLLCIRCSDPVPCSSVTPACGRVTPILLVLLVGQLLMLGTIPFLGQFFAPRVTTGMLGLSRHRQHLLQFESEDVPALLGIGNLSVRHRSSSA